MSEDPIANQSLSRKEKNIYQEKREIHFSPSEYQ